MKTVKSTNIIFHDKDNTAFDGLKSVITTCFFALVVVSLAYGTFQFFTN